MFECEVRRKRFSNFAKDSAASKTQEKYTRAMRSHIRLTRPQRTPIAARRLARQAAISRNVTRSRISVVSRKDAIAVQSFLSSEAFQPNPYLDYGRWLTPEGGVLIVYKDIDTRLRHTMWRLLVWSICTGYEGWFLLYHSPLHRAWVNLVCLAAIAIINWLIVAKPVELYRKIEIRPDCLIVEGTDIFWRRYMEGGAPSFRPDDKGNQVLCGIYGTRFVEYLIARRFDEHDRMPETFDAHLQDAMRQLWTRPLD